MPEAGIPGSEPPDGYYTVGDLAQILQLSERTVQDLLTRRKLCPFVRVGRAFRIRKSTFHKWQEDREKNFYSDPSGVMWR